MPSLTLKENALLSAVAATCGVVTATLGLPASQLKNCGIAGPMNKAGHAAAKALQAHATIGGALGAGATAAVGGPAVVTTAVAAAPYVAAGVAALVAAGLLMKGYEMVTGEELFPEKE